MPKMKTKRSLAKRVKVTGKGKLKRYKSGHSHLLTSKSKTRKRRLRQSTTVEGSNERRMKKLLPKVGRSK
ncbi:50S ribosomal protein L35 [candidate division TA06 bacterium B3_TA06]|uniref:Large ribosomal subunit protein bL35 n=1 Tax=candidate division TA06 bacterium B3_TA06 TaxID=2012487 RepID=A0A532VAL6_UNCT6|nr:MAG: 50S ribosomal protein L35 [candidate division TA06 bacterium B3_TA06]